MYSIVLNCGHLNNLEIVNKECNICLKEITIEDKIIITLHKIQIIKSQNNMNDEKIKLLEESLSILKKTIKNYNNNLTYYKQHYEFINKIFF